MTLIRPDGTEGGSHDLRPGENKLGRSFGAVFENDGGKVARIVFGIGDHRIVVPRIEAK